MPRSTSAPTTAACSWGRPPARAFACSTASAASCALARAWPRAAGSAPRPWSAPSPPCMAARPGCDGGRCRHASRHCHRGLPAGGERARVPRTAFADETGLRFDVISSREEAELALESCTALAACGSGGARWCSTSAADRPSWPGCAFSRGRSAGADRHRSRCRSGWSLSPRTVPGTAGAERVRRGGRRRSLP